MDKNQIISILREYKNNFAEKYGIISIGVFGSVARDQSNDDSDIDICIKTVSPNPFFLVHIKEDIEKRVNRRVDIVRIGNKMNPALKSRIEKDGVYV
ncbi:MAG: nucleotidyltransferase domain-containing protein [Proteobacteria bacterium]|nr:nucleotidyltransferase domain-containing protein [Pseudomonadota bacterium]